MIYVTTAGFIAKNCEVCGKPTKSPIDSETKYCGRECKKIAKLKRYQARQQLKIASNDTAIRSDGVGTVKGKVEQSDATGNELEALQAKGVSCKGLLK